MAKQKQYGLAEARKFKLSFSIVVPLLIFLVFFQTVTQHLAHQAGYHPALGEPLFRNFYWPWSAFIWKSLFGRNAYLEALQLGLIAAALPLAVAVATTRKLKKKGGIADLHGSARWATLAEIKAMGLLSGAGVYIGGFYDAAKKITYYLRHDGPEHIMGFAPTRSGKGVGPILMTLLSWLGSVVCMDIKGENWALSSGFRKRLGHNLFRFEPADPSGKGAKFNILNEIRLGSNKAIPDVQNIATMIVDPDGKGLEDYWAKSGFAFTAGVVLHTIVTVQHEEGQRANMSEVAFAIASEHGDINELFNAMLETDHAGMVKALYPDMPDAHGQEIHRFIASSGQEMLNKSDNERSGVIGTAMSNLSLYRDPVVTMNTARSDFTIDDLMNADQPCGLYLVLSPNDIARLKPLIRLILAMIMNRHTEVMEFKDGRSVAGYKHKLLMLLDEFTSVGRLQIIEHAISFCAGYGIKLMLIIQDVKQLYEKYGKDNALMGNCHIRFAYAPNDPDTARLLSDMTGKTTIIHDKESASGGSGKKSTSTSVQETARPLLTPDETTRLPGIRKNSKGEVLPGDMLIFVAGNSPIYGRQALYFQDPVFMARAKISPPECSDRLDKTSPLPAASPAEDAPAMPAGPAASPNSENTSKRNTFDDFLNS